MIWNYLRSKVRDSILAGVADALAEVEGNGPTDDTTHVALALLRQRLAPALSAPSLTPMALAVPAASTGATENAEGASAPVAPRNGRKRTLAAE